ncbi:MAG: hypothetical protein IKM85_04690 [Bacteroidales bacterium]|nr:hypothetical protein [Bacteroidales bacterium]
MKKLLMTAAAIMLLMTLSVQTTSCSKEKDTMEIVINLDSIVIKPYVKFGAPLADVKAYMAQNFADYPEEHPDSLEYIELDGGGLWSKYYMKEDRWISFFFTDAEGKDLTMVSYDFFFPIQIEAVMAELERNGFTNKGEVEFENDNSDLSFLFLSPDESIEAMPFYWEKDGGSWAITFQPTNDFDLQHLVNQ